MDPANFWTAASVIVAALVGMLSLLPWYLDRRKQNSTASELTAEGADWVVEHGLSYEELIRLLISLDHAALEGLTDSSSGNAATKSKVYEKSTETWGLVVFRDSLIVGYWSFFSLSDRLIGRIKNGLMHDAEITASEVHSIREPRQHNLYFEMFGIHPGFQKNKRTIFRMLCKSLADAASVIQSEAGVKAIYATGFSARGAELCRAFGLLPLVKSAQGGNVYYTTDLRIPLKRLETMSSHRRVP